MFPPSLWGYGTTTAGIHVRVRRDVRGAIVDRLDASKAAAFSEHLGTLLP